MMRGSPLAMLAAQCNKLTSKSPPPLADAAVGKGGHHQGVGGAGFHPWKKSTPNQGVGGTGQSLTGVGTEDSHSNNTASPGQGSQSNNNTIAASPGQPPSPAQSNYSAHSTHSPTPQYGKFTYIYISIVFIFYIMLYVQFIFFLSLTHKLSFKMLINVLCFRWLQLRVF